MPATSRGQLAQVAVISLLAGFIISALFGPPDPFGQLTVAVGIIAISIGFGYWTIYKTGVAVPELSWGDMFRGIVTTFLVWMLIAFPIAAFTTADEGSVAPLFQFVILIISAVIAGIVISSENIPWPGDD